MVVCIIFVLLSTIVLTSHTRFGGVVTLQNLAHNVALAIREAQVFGLATLQHDSNQFDTGYGIHIAQGNNYELFADVNGNGIWDSGGTETVKTTTITGGYSISNICAPAATCDVSRIDILFKRPEPDACISAGGVVTFTDGVCGSTISRATITLSSARGDTATIVVESTGQISVQ